MTPKSAGQSGRCDMQNIDIINLVGAVQNPTSTSSPDQTTPQFTSGRQSELCISEVHGKYYIAAYRGKVFHGQNTAFTIPVVGATSASKFTLYNPASSPVLAEIFSTELNCLVAPEVVDTFGWYAALPSNIAAGTFTSSIRLTLTQRRRRLASTWWVHTAQLPLQGDLERSERSTTASCSSCLGN